MNKEKIILNKQNIKKKLLIFIEKNIKIGDNYKTNIKELEKLKKFFDDINYTPDTEIYLEIIKNDEIKNLLIEIVKKNKMIIEQGEVNLIFDNEILMSLIETFYLENYNEYNIEQVYIQTQNDIKKYRNDSIKNYLEEIDKKILTKEQEQELARKIKNNDSDARKIFIERNLKLVVSIAKNYVGKGLEFMDLIQEGSIGLIKAVEKFDPNKGYKFSTYATWWIRQSIKRAISNKSRNIRIPIYMHDKVKKYIKVKERLEEELNRKPTIEELQEEIHETKETIEKLEKLKKDTVSLNKPVSEENENEIGDYVKDERNNLEEEFFSNNLYSEIMDLLKKCNLNDMEKDIIMLRNGIGIKKPITLVELGKKYNVSRERIRQIEIKVLEKLRASKYIKEFAFYMDDPNQALKNIDTLRKQKYKKIGKK